MKPTDEQQQITDAFGDIEELVVQAGAGVGKTTLLRMLGQSCYPDRNGILMAFNRAVAHEAKASFPINVRCGTAHSFAFASVGKRYEHRLPDNRPRVTSKDIAENLGIRVWFSVREKGRKDISPWKIASLANDTVQRFCRSDDSEIKPRHVPFMMGVPNMDELRAVVLPWANLIWTDMQKLDGVLGFEPDHYFKMWALGDPHLFGDFLMVDEVQDTNPVLSGVIEKQTHMQRVLVGDSQQQLFAWRGAVDYMNTFIEKHDPTVLYLTQSFRFGDAVAEEANRWLGYLDAPLRLRGLESIDSELTHIERPNAVLCRTNADVVAQAMRAQDEGVSVGIVGGTKGIISFAEAAQQLQTGGKTSHRELSIFKSWSDVMTYVGEENPGGDFGTFVRLIDRYGATRVATIAGACVDEKSAERVVSTVHKVKGLEWDRVTVDGGVAPGEDGDAMEPDPASLMIPYVAVTRAKLELDTSAIDQFHQRRARMEQMRAARQAALEAKTT